MRMEPVAEDRKGHAHLEHSAKAPKFHVGQKVKAVVTGTVKEVSEGYDGTGHRLRLEPTKILYAASPGEDFLKQERKRK